jgi:hypothetical protein
MASDTKFMTPGCGFVFVTLSFMPPV